MNKVQYSNNGEGKRFKIYVIDDRAMEELYELGIEDPTVPSVWNTVKSHASLVGEADTEEGAIDEAEKHDGEYLIYDTELGQAFN